MTEKDPVLLNRVGAVATVTINRPHRKNAIDTAAWNGLFDAFQQVARDTEVRVVVVTGADGDFSAGADLGADRGEHPLTRMHRVNDVAMALNEISKPTIAKVDGVAVGAGWNLALGCDLVVASERARFSQIFAKRGLSLDFGGSWLLPRLVGMQQAKRLALRAEMIGAAEARDLGLVTWVRPVDELDSFVDSLTAELAELPPVALSLSKRLLEEGASRTLRESLEGEARAQTVNFATEDAPAAIQAFLNKTEATYTGRWAVR